MLELMWGALVLAIVVVVVLLYFEAIDPGELIAGLVRLVAEVVRLAAGLLFAAGAFFVWLVRRGGREKQP